VPSLSNQTEDMMAAFSGTSRNTNGCESYFGSIKYYENLFHCSVANANGVVAAQVDQLFDVISPKYIGRTGRRVDDARASKSTRRKRRRQTARAGRCSAAALGADMESAVWEVARTTGGAEYAANAHADEHEADEASCAKSKAEEEKAIEDQIDKTAKAIEKINVTPLVADADVMNPRKTLASLQKQLETAVAALPSTAAKTRTLKGTLQRWVGGMGFAQLKPKEYASAKPENAQTIGKEGTDVNIAHLTSICIAAMKEIKEEKLELVNEPVVPELHRRALPQLGTATLTRVALESEQLRSLDEVRAAAEERRKRPRPRSSQRAARPCPERPPPPEINDQLLKRRVVVVYEMTHKKRDGSSLTRSYWCPGVIDKVSTAPTTFAGKKLGLGNVHIKFDEGRPEWLLANRTSFWRATKPGGWCFEEDLQEVTGGDGDGDDESDVDEEELEDAESDSGGESGEDEDDWGDI